MKFYDCRTAPSPRRVRMFMAEKGIEVTTVEVDLRNGEQLGKAFLRVNPHATVPVLELDDGTRLLTTAGCRAYLERAYPEPALLGRDAREQGLVADLVWRIENDAFMAVAEALRNTVKGMVGRALTGPDDYGQIPALAARGRTRAERFMPSLDALIGEQPFLAGEAPSAADIDAFVFVEFAGWIKLSMPAECANLRRWHAAMRSRPSAER